MITPSHTHTDAQDPWCAALLVSRLTRTQKTPSALLPTGAPGAEGQYWPTDHGQDSSTRQLAFTRVEDQLPCRDTARPCPAPETP